MNGLACAFVDSCSELLHLSHTPVPYLCPCQYPPWHTIIKDKAGTPVHFGGFIPELLHELSIRLNFTYDLVEPRDGSWEGMIDLVEEEVRMEERRNFL